MNETSKAVRSIGTVSEMAKLTEATNELGSVVDQLEARLGPAMLPEALTMGKESGLPPAGLCAIAEGIRESRYRVDQAIGRLGGLLSRLDI
jgi:hypothetical protein